MGIRSAGRRACGGGAIVIALLAGVTDCAAAPAPAATRPAATAPAADPRQVRLHLLGLDDADPGVRDRSREALMGLRREDLPELAAAVRQFAPLTPAHLAAVKDVAIHVYLTGHEYPKDREGFLGIILTEAANEPAAAAAADGARLIIDQRMPGFSGYRHLRDGDVILDVVERPLPKPVDRRTFMSVLRQTEPGRTLTLRVLRGGRPRDVKLRVDARPHEDENWGGVEFENRVREMLHQRRQEAERYWKERFGDP